jgi:bifunctional DNA-binding transcriptional regulator/antitoxin component of YhaV-PrlF toxin-antitoxin module
VEKLKVRRLLDIKPQHVSLVDRAANKRKFVLIKREGDVSMDEVTKALGKVETALNDLSDRLEKVEKKETTFEFKFDVDKAGAKIAKATLEQLKKLHEALTSIISNASPEDSTEKNLSDEEVLEALTKGVSKGLGIEEKKNDETDITKIAEAIVNALKATPTK